MIDGIEDRECGVTARERDGVERETGARRERDEKVEKEKCRERTVRETRDLHMVGRDSGRVE